MDLGTISGADLGPSLKGMGINLLVPDVPREADFLCKVFTMCAYQATQDFAILTWQDQILMLHADATYHDNPYLGMLPEQPPRGVGAELHLYNQDPDQAQAVMEAMIIDAEQKNSGGEACGMLLQPAKDKPHGLREAYILSPSGYCWVPSIPLT